MEKNLRLPIQFLPDNNRDFTFLKINFSELAVERLCLGFALLKEKLVHNLNIKDEDNKFSLNVELLPKKRRAELTWHEAGASLKLATNELDYCFMFFLRIFSDGKSEINHIDIECMLIEPRRTGYVTFIAPPSLFQPAKWKGDFGDETL